MADAKEQVAESIVNARANLEQALADLERLPSFDAGSAVLAGHVLGNYLTVTGLTAEMLTRALTHYPDPQVGVWLDVIRRATELMTQIATELMKHTTVMHSPRLVLDRVDLTTLVERGCTFYQRKADEKGIRMTWETRLDRPYARADRVALAAVLDNVLSNAVKFSPRDTLISVTLRQEAEFLVCSVQDQGPGISEDDQAKLFQRGVRLSAVPTAGEISTGFGLAIARELIEAQGGSIWCESRLGHGARFSFRIPTYRE